MQLMIEVPQGACLCSERGELLECLGTARVPLDLEGHRLQPCRSEAEFLEEEANVVGLVALGGGAVVPIYGGVVRLIIIFNIAEVVESRKLVLTCR
jgi:hypothetical protein